MNAPSIPNREPSREKVRNHRARLRAQGLRQVQLWVPEVRSVAFKEEAAHFSKMIAESPYEKDDQAFIDSISSFWDDDHGTDLI